MSFICAFETVPPILPRDRLAWTTSNVRSLVFWVMVILLEAAIKERNGRSTLDLVFTIVTPVPTVEYVFASPVDDPVPESMTSHAYLRLFVPFGGAFW